MTRYRGFTLIEMLVVIAIMAVLVSLLLPAVQQAQEAARRATCKNNLRQLGFAFYSYTNAFQTLPPGVVNQRGPIEQLPRGYHHNWVVSLLPYLDEAVLANRIDPKLSIYAKEQLPARKHVAHVLLCPSDPASSRSRDNLGAVGLTNFAGCHHQRSASIDTNNHGVLFLNSRIRHEDIYDGSAYTLMVGEILRDAEDFGWASGTRATLRNTGIDINQTPAGSLYYNDLRPEIDQQVQQADTGWLNDADMDSDSTDDAPLPAGAATRPPSPAAPNNFALDPGGFGSHHVGGAQFLMCDGAVRFLSENISRSTFEQLGDRADGQEPDPDMY